MPRTPIGAYPLASAVQAPPPARRERKAGARPGGRSVAELNERLAKAQDRMIRVLRSPDYVTVDIHYFKH